MHHWFYLYIVWFYPLLLVALVDGESDLGKPPRSSRSRGSLPMRPSDP